MPLTETRVVDPTGGGDALVATLAVLLGRGEAMGAALSAATSAAGSTVSRLGGTPRT